MIRKKEEPKSQVEGVFCFVFFLIDETFQGIHAASGQFVLRDCKGKYESCLKRYIFKGFKIHKYLVWYWRSILEIKYANGGNLGYTLYTTANGQTTPHMLYFISVLSVLYWMVQFHLQIGIVDLGNFLVIRIFFFVIQIMLWGLRNRKHSFCDSENLYPILTQSCYLCPGKKSKGDGEEINA